MHKGPSLAKRFHSALEVPTMKTPIRVVFLYSLVIICMTYCGEIEDQPEKYFSSDDELTSIEAKKYCESRNGYVLLGQDSIFSCKVDEIKKMKRKDKWRKLNW